MYRFKQIKARYSFVSKVFTPSGECSAYSKIEHIEVLPNLVEGLNFTLQVATQELINEDAPKDFDLIISRLGHSLYPIELNVLKSGEIKRIKNFTDIKSRWNKESNSVLTTHKNAYWVERYINMTSKNLENENRFMCALLRNNFIQLLLIDEAAPKLNLNITDFPLTGSRMNTEYRLMSSKQGNYHYRSEIDRIDNRTTIGEGELFISYTEKGLTENVSLCCVAEVANEGFYRKQIELKLMELK